MTDRTPADRLRHLLMAAFTEDRQRNPGKPVDSRAMHALVERMLATPAGRVLEQEWTEARVAEGLWLDSVADVVRSTSLADALDEARSWASRIDTPPGLPNDFRPARRVAE